MGMKLNPHGRSIGPQRRREMQKYNSNPNDVTPDNKGYSTDTGMREDAGIFRDDFVKPTAAEWNIAHGRLASSPTSGQADGRGKTPQGRAPGAPNAKSVRPID
jgi:hypothetical protein